MSKQPFTRKSDWTMDLISQYYDEIADIADNDFGLTYYPNQIEIINSEQMIDAYASIGMPIMYNHWSFGQEFLNTYEHYQRGHMGLAYEIVINSNPCIAYLMEENTMLMQILVMAHACIGHNTFFKNNYLFKQWTNADYIIDYLVFAKKFIADCEEEHGPAAVEEILDACHALMQFGVDKYKRPPSLSVQEEKDREAERKEWHRSHINEIWNTVPSSDEKEREAEDRFPKEPEENLLYFVEKNAPKLEQWQREIIRIVRKIAQYFYPQRQTQLMNEGCATFFHYEIVHKLRERGVLTQGMMLEFYDSHTGVTYQPDFDDPRYSGINPYALGFAMYKDIQRICMEPTEEDREWFPDFAGNGDWLKTVKWAVESFKDESFVSQFLSPKVIRDFKLFNIKDDDRDPKIEVTAIHDKRGYKLVREMLSKQYNIGYRQPDLQVYDVDRWGDRSLTLRHKMVNRKPLEPHHTTEVLKHLSVLWGYDVILQSVNDEDQVTAEYQVNDDQTLLDVFEHDTP